VLSLEHAFPNGLAGLVEAADPDVAFRAAVAAAEGGVSTIEVATSFPDCIDVARGVSASTGAIAGIGGVTDPRFVAQARKARLPFVASPFQLAEVAAECRRDGILCVMGAMTPTEIHRARAAGASLVKVFPIGAVGGAEYIRALRGTLPDVPFLVSGGVRIEDIPEYLRLGVFVGLGSELFPRQALERADYATIRELAGRGAVQAGALSRPIG
jgi:2-dehydro-3-deoxyphosphogluconate aldolase/(4S)-4-hydroxy-2-oxoglutarate aldolase